MPFYFFMVCACVKMEIPMRLWNKDAMIFIRPWIPILLGLHMQFSWATTCPDECRCDRTFVYCNERSLTSVPLGIGEGYKTLYLHNNQINNAGFPIELHNVASVETVHLYGNQLDEFPVNLPKNTRVLHLQENNIQTVSRAALAQLLRLEELYLDDNSISTVGVEEGAFREAISLKILFLTKNHLSSVPVGLPEDLKELRLDENRIALITDDAFENVTSLEVLLLDGNLLTDEGLAPGAFQGLVNLKTLSMARNSLTVPPQNLPTQRLVKLNFQDNLMNKIPLTAFHGLRHLEKLDISSNQLQSLTQGVFDSLLSLRQLTVRNNLWHCDCNIKWVILWLKSLPAALNVRGFMCQKPESVRGMVIRELNLEMIQCPGSTAAVPQSTQWPTSQAFVPESESVSQTVRPPVNDVNTLSLVPSPSTLPSVLANGEPRTENPEDPGQESLRVSFIVLNSSCILVNWISTFTVMAYKVTWVRLGHSLSADPVQETMVNGEQQRVHLSNLEPRSMYRICVDPLDAFNNYHVGEDSICSEVVTKPASYDLDEKTEQASQRDLGSSLLLAGLIGGAVLVILVLMLSVFCWHMHRKGRSPQSKWKYNRGRRKDDYCEAGTKKDNSILEMTETSFQIVSLNNQQLLKGDYQIQPIYTPNGGIGYRDDCHVTNNSTFCKNSVPASNPCHT